MVETLLKSDATNRAVFIDHQPNGYTTRNAFSASSLRQSGILGNPSLLITDELGLF